MRPTAAPAHFPYRDHRTVEQVDRDRKRNINYQRMMRKVRREARKLKAV